MKRTTTMVALAGMLAGSIFLASPQSARAEQQTWRTSDPSVRAAAPERIHRRIDRRRDRRMDRQFDRRVVRRMDRRMDRRFDRRMDRRMDRRHEFRMDRRADARFDRGAGRRAFRARNHDGHWGYRGHARASCARSR